MVAAEIMFWCEGFGTIVCEVAPECDADAVARVMHRSCLFSYVLIGVKLDQGTAQTSGQGGGRIGYPP